MIDKWDGWDYVKQAYRRECEYCKRIFHTNNERDSFCSPVCSHKYYSGASNVICKNCKREFEQIHAQRIYCSNACRQQAYRKRKKHDPVKNWRKKALASKRKQVFKKICEQCNSTFTVSGLAKKRQFCSNACKQAHYRNQKMLDQL